MKSLPFAQLRRIGLGVARVAIEGRPDRQTGIGVVATALEAGVPLVDTADAYCINSSAEHGYGESIVAEALNKARRASALIATKVGEWRPGDGRWTLRGQPDHLIAAGEASLGRLGVEAIDLLQLHRPDPDVPIEESVGALDELRRRGVTRHIGVCNVTATELARALAVAPLAAVQNPLSVAAPHQDEVLRWCEERDMAFLAHSPLGGPGRAHRLGDLRALASVADELDVSVQVVALAWLLARSPVIVPIPGTTNGRHALDNQSAETLVLSDRHLQELSPT